MRTDRQTDLTKLTVAFHNFSKAPKNERTPQLGSALYSIWDVMVLPPSLGCTEFGKHFLHTRGESYAVVCLPSESPEVQLDAHPEVQNYNNPCKN